jgi:hypothetical protein
MNSHCFSHNTPFGRKETMNLLDLTLRQLMQSEYRIIQIMAESLHRELIEQEEKKKKKRKF